MKRAKEEKRAKDEESAMRSFLCPSFLPIIFFSFSFFFSASLFPVLPPLLPLT